MQNTSNKQFAVVTGASSGIGLELAKQFAQNGFDLLLIAEDAGINTAAHTIRTMGVDVRALQQDLATREGVDKAYAAIEATGRAIDAIALNAGVGVGGAFVDIDMEKDVNLLMLNVVSTTVLAKYVLRKMKARNKGRVLFTGSIVSEMPGPFQATYAASKAYVYSLALALRNELKDTQITVTVLQPGATETNFFHRAGLDDTKVGQDKKDNPADVAKQGFDALMAGDAKVVAASFKSKMMGVIDNILPDTAKAEMHRSMSEPGSGKKKANN